MAKTITNTSRQVLQINDLGNRLNYDNKLFAQSLNLQVGANVTLVETDAVTASIAKGSIKKFRDASKLTVA